MSGIPVAVASKMIERLKCNLPVWEELISQSFLPDKMKASPQTTALIQGSAVRNLFPGRALKTIIFCTENKELFGFLCSFL